jgi:hypothetical protein
MDRMMDRMIVNLSVAEKEELMLQMMPAMMEGIEIGSLVPRLLREVGSAVTLSGIFNLLQTALKDDELRHEFGDITEVLKERLPALTEALKDMMPLMTSIMADTGLMDGMMGLMERVMPLMMPMMREMMPTMMNDRMPKLMAQHNNVNELMPAMMVDILPQCVEMITPQIEQEERTAFLSRLAEKIELVAA